MLFRLKSISILLLSRGLTSTAFVSNGRSQLHRALSQHSLFSYDRSGIKARGEYLYPRLSVRFVSTSVSATEVSATTEANSGGAESTAEPEQVLFTAYVVNLSYSTYQAPEGFYKYCAFKTIDLIFVSLISCLNTGTTLQQIHGLFSQHAPVVKVYMPFDKQDSQKSKGYAFVSFASKEELDQVISATHESEVDGRTVFVTEAKPRGPKSSDAVSSGENSSYRADAAPRRSQDASTKLYVGNISYDTTADDLGDLFSPYGKVIDTYLPVDTATGTPRGFAFVTLSSDDVDAAIRDLDGIDFFGTFLQHYVSTQYYTSLISH